MVAELPLPEGSAILSDRIGHLPQRQSHNRHNPFQDPVREVRVATDTGKILRILTNDLDASAKEIADLAQTAQNAVSSPLAFARLVRANLMLRRRIDRLLEPEPANHHDQAQIAILWN